MKLKENEYLIDRHYTYPFWKYYALTVTVIDILANIYILSQTKFDIFLFLRFLSMSKLWIIYFINVFAVLGSLCTVGDIVDDSDPRIRKERKIDNL